jgi:hypothetical protein
MKASSQVACYMSRHVPRHVPRHSRHMPRHVKNNFTAEKFFYEILILSEKSKNDKKDLGQKFDPNEIR